MRGIHVKAAKETVVGSTFVETGQRAGTTILFTIQKLPCMCVVRCFPTPRNNFVIGNSFAQFTVISNEHKRYFLFENFLLCILNISDTVYLF